MLIPHELAEPLFTHALPHPVNVLRSSVTVLVEAPAPLSLPEQMQYRSSVLMQPLWINQHMLCMPHPISVPSFWNALPYLAESLMAPNWVLGVFSHSSVWKAIADYILYRVIIKPMHRDVAFISLSTHQVLLSNFQLLCNVKFST